jgi:hypothetical protein
MCSLKSNHDSTTVLTLLLFRKKEKEEEDPCCSSACRAGPGVSLASPWAWATPHPKATNGKIKKIKI